MARSRSPDRDKAYEIYKENNGKIDLVEIASQLNLSAGTIRGWKAKDNWEQQSKLPVELVVCTSPRRALYWHSVSRRIE